MSNTVCPQCGAPLEAGATACKYCGEKIATNSVNQNMSYQQQSQPQPQQFAYQQPVDNTQQYYDGINPAWPIKSKIVAGILGILLGGLGIHKFYLGKTGKGILYILFCWTYIPALVGLVEGIIYLCSSDHNFQVKNHVRLN